MKNIIKGILIIIGVFVILIVIDLISVFNFNKPIFAIKKDPYTYHGILYNTYNCPEFSVPSIKMKFTKYACAVSNKNKSIKKIVDKTTEIKDFLCAEALEEFYQDEEYRYYYSCIKSNYIVVQYDDGSEETVEEALKAKRIKIEDLDTYKISYYKEVKDE